MVAATDPQAGPVSNPMPKPENRVWKKFRHHRSAMLGGFLVLFFIAMQSARRRRWRIFSAPTKSAATCWPG